MPEWWISISPGERDMIIRGLRLKRSRLAKFRDRALSSHQPGNVVARYDKLVAEATALIERFDRIDEGDE